MNAAPTRPAQQLTVISSKVVMADSRPMLVYIPKQRHDGAEAWNSTHPISMGINHSWVSLSVIDAEYLHAQLGQCLAEMGRGMGGLW